MEEYKIWKKNSPFFYDTLYSHALTWPSLTVEWMPQRVVPYEHGSCSDHTVQKLLLGTYTSNEEQNYLQIVSVKIPLESSKDTRDYKDNVLDDNTNGIGGSTIVGSKTKGGKDTQNKENEDNKLLANSKQARISIDVQINHQGEVNKARYMP